MPTTTTGIATEFIQFTRASNATVTDSDGKVKWAPHNLLTNSESFASSPWATYNATIASNSDVAPNGTTTADRFTIGGVAPSVYVLNGILAGQHTLAFFAKAGTSSTAGISVSALGNGQLATFNMSTLATSITALGTGGTVSGGTASITAVGSGWFLCVFANVITTGTNNVGYSIEGTSGQTGLIWGASLYRSDLAMQPNTSAYPMYNPTTPKNALGYTEDWSNAAWGKTNCTIASNSTVAPNGLTTADTLTASSTSTTVYTNQSMSNATAQTASVYAKAGTSSFIGLQIYNSNSWANFNLATGVVASSNGCTPSITPVGSSGWYRCAVVNNTFAGGNYVVLGKDVDPGAAPFGNGNMTSGNTVHLWGAQLSDSASLDSYVPVYGAAVTSAAYYGPRRDFDGATLACKGLLVEEQRVNLVLNSAAFDNASWSRDNLNTSGTPAWSNVAVAPDGTQTADKLIPNSGSGIHRTYVLPSGSSSTIAQAHSLYAKAAENTKIAIGYAGGPNFLAVDLSTGTQITSFGVSSTTITSVGNGWYRISTVITGNGGYFGVYVLPNTYTTGNPDANAYAGNDANGLFVWGAQLEAGSFATSYIPTGAATATRNADVASVSTQAFPYSSTEGTLVGAYSLLAASGTQYITALGVDSNNQIYMIGNNSAGSSDAAVITGGSGQGFNPIAGAVASSTVKQGFAFATNNTAHVVSGGSPLTDATVTMPSAANILNLGTTITGFNSINGHIRQITYLPRRISNTELQTRTA
jgi:hypothetical protein